MAIYRDFDFSLRVNGDINVPSNSIILGSNITLDKDGSITALKFNGDGSGLTNLSSDAMSDAFLIDGSRRMQGDFEYGMPAMNYYGFYWKDDSRQQYVGAYGYSDDSNNIMGFESWGDPDITTFGFYMVDGSTGNYLANPMTITNAQIEVGRHLYANENATIEKGLTINSGGLTASGQTISAGTINASSNLQENGTNLSSKYLGINAKADDSNQLDGQDSSYYAQSSVVSGHINNGSIHKDWGQWSTNGVRDLKVYGKRAMVGYDTADGDILRINYAGDFANGIYMYGPVSIDGKTVWHSGNLNLSNYVRGDVSGQTVASNFTMTGRAWIGTTNNSGSLVFRDDANENTIYIAADPSDTVVSNVKTLIYGNGNATFGGTVEVDGFIINTNNLIENLNAEYIGGSRETEFVRTPSIRDIHGYGIQSGLDVTQKSPTPDMTVTVHTGVAYTDSGRRFFYPDTVVPIPKSPSTSGWSRYDIVYIRGQEGGQNEGMLNVYTGAAGQYPTIEYDALPVGAIILAVIFVDTNIGTITDGSTGEADVIDTTPRKLMSLRLNEGLTYSINEDLYVDGAIKEKGQFLEDKYLELAKDNILYGNILMDNPGANIEIRGTLNNDTESPTLFLSAYNGNTYGLKLKYYSAGNYATLGMVESSVEQEAIRIDRSTVKVTVQQDLDVNGVIKSSKNAETVTIPAGSTSTTWTHNYGSTSYAINLTSNSFERHIRWTNKNSNNITIEIDDPADEDILVDCIIIGY